MNLNKLFSVIETDTVEQNEPITLMANPVISANSLSNDAANDHHLKSVVNENKAEITAGLEKEDNFRITIQDEAVSLDLSRYANLITCQQCEHLTITGYCRVKPQYRPMPEAMRGCGQFNQLKSECISTLEVKPYSTTELNDVLSQYEKKLFHHLVDCVVCSFMEGKYCVDAFAIGSSYDALLLVFDDAASKREALLNAVIMARVTGRKVFVSLNHDKVPPPR